MTSTQRAAAAAASDAEDRYNGGVSVSGNSYGYAQQQPQGYFYPQDARQQGQASHQYSESGGYPSQQAYQQQLAYAGLQQSASQPYWYPALKLKKLAKHWQMVQNSQPLSPRVA